MKVILKQDVLGAGRKGDVKEVKNGYAINFLFPKGLAIPATSGNIKEAERMRREREASLAKEKAEFEKRAEGLKEAKIEIKAKSGDSGMLFGSIGPKEIAGELHKKGFEGITEEDIILDPHIKKIGSYKINIEKYGKKENFSLDVIPEENVKEKKEKK